MTTKEIILQELEQIPDLNLIEILDFIRTLKSSLNTTETTYKPIWEVADDIIQEIPEEVFNQLPQDSAQKHDYYLYQKQI